MSLPIIAQSCLVSLAEENLVMKRFTFTQIMFFVFSIMAGGPSFADGMVGMVVSAPIFANGTVRDIRTGINIYLQSAAARGLDFMDPEVVGYGIPPGGRLEVEMVSGFQRDPNVPLAQPSILLVAGTPQQGLPGRAAGYTVSEGRNRNTFVITPSTPKGLDPARLVTDAAGAKRDRIPQRGIKIIHIGMKMSFVNRGPAGRVEVRVLDSRGAVVNSGTGEIEFLAEPRPQIFPTNIPHDKRNHNWQRIAPGQSAGGTEGTVPLSFLLFERNEGFGNKGITGAGVLSARELGILNYRIPEPLRRYTGGLILKDSNGDGLLDPGQDQIIGGVFIDAPEGAKGHEARTPLFGDRHYLSRPTGVYNKRAGAKLGGAVMLVEFKGGDKKGIYRPTFALLRDPSDITSPDGSSYVYTVVVE
jgi:hypothetical protein